MLKFFIRLVLVSTTMFLINIEETAGDDNFPLILIKSPTKLETPIGAISKKTETQQRLEIYYYKFGLRYYNEEIFFCPAESQKQIDDIEKSNELLSQQTPFRNKISKNCLFEQTRTKLGYVFGTSEPCREKLQPVMQKYLKKKDSQDGISEFEQLEHVSCGSAEKNAKKYFYGYQICVEFDMNEKAEKIQEIEDMPEEFPFNDVIDYEIYHFCYDNETKDTMYTVHEIKSPKLLDNEILVEQRSQGYEMNSFGYGLFENNFEIFEQKIKTIENLFKDEVTYYKPQRFIPPEDLAFASWTKPIYHYANIGLIHEELHPFWERVEGIIRKYAKKREHTNKFQIYTGAFKLSPPDSTQVHEIEGLQVPEIWVKLLHHVHHDEVDYNPTIIKSAMAVIANNYLSEDVSLQIEKQLCAVNLCPNFDYKFVWCCHATENLQKLFAVKLDFSQVLKIKEFDEVAKDSTASEKNSVSDN